MNIESKRTIDKQSPVLYENKDECCGCGACYAICPKKAISMKLDTEGFLYPCIDLNVCVRCYKCINTCAFKKKDEV